MSYIVMVNNKGFSAWWRYMGCSLDCLGWTIKNNYNNLGMYICYWQTNKRRKIIIKLNRFNINNTKHNKQKT